MAPTYRKMERTHPLELGNPERSEYEAAAAGVERFNLVRRRAYQIWEEQGRPDGLHADHWHDAELQVAEDERNEGEDPVLGKP